MGRAYAGVLGPLAFMVVVARSLAGHTSVETALYNAPLALFVFAAIGSVIGFVADKTVVEAVETRFHSQLQAQDTPELQQ